MKLLRSSPLICILCLLNACGSLSEYQVATSTGRVQYSQQEREEAIERRTQAILDEGVITDKDKARERARQEIFNHEVTGTSVRWTFQKNPPKKTITPPSSSGGQIDFK